MNAYQCVQLSNITCTLKGCFWKGVYAAMISTVLFPLPCPHCHVHCTLPTLHACSIPGLHTCTILSSTISSCALLVDSNFDSVASSTIWLTAAPTLKVLSAVLESGKDVCKMGRGLNVWEWGCATHLGETNDLWQSCLSSMGVSNTSVHLPTTQEGHTRMS